MSESANSKDYATVTPYLIVANVSRLIEFLTDAFGATERLRMMRPDGSVGHCEMTIGDSIVMMGEPMPPFAPMPASIFLRVPDCDAAYRKALHAGATSMMEPADMIPAGERYGGVKDPCGNLWWPATKLKMAKGG